MNYVFQEDIFPRSVELSLIETTLSNHDVPYMIIIPETSKLLDEKQAL